jgi:hypothetical protein
LKELAQFQSLLSDKSKPLPKKLESKTDVMSIDKKRSLYDVSGQQDEATGMRSGVVS